MWVTRSRAPKGRLWVAAAFCVALVALYKLTFGNLLYTRPQAMKSGYPNPTLPKLSLHSVHAIWYGRPVYVLTNQSNETLPHIVVYNWAGSALTPLEIGTRNAKNLQSSAPLNHPPYILSPGSSLWFAGSTSPPAKFTVMWNGPSKKTVYEFLSVQAHS